jgi:hypothetical protein
MATQAGRRYAVGRTGIRQVAHWIQRFRASPSTLASTRPKATGSPRARARKNNPCDSNLAKPCGSRGRSADADRMELAGNEDIAVGSGPKSRPTRSQTASKTVSPHRPPPKARGAGRGSNHRPQRRKSTHDSLRAFATAGFRRPEARFALLIPLLLPSTSSHAVTDLGDNYADNYYKQSHRSHCACIEHRVEVLRLVTFMHTLMS